MEINQINKLKMGQATLGCLQEEANAALWQGIVGIEEAVTETEEIVAAIIAASQKQSVRNGLAAEKQVARAAMLSLAFTVCSGLKAMAAATGDQKLAAQVSFSRSALSKGREADVINRCKALADLGTVGASALAAKYNVTANELQAFKAAITDFTGTQPKPRQGRAVSASATKELETLFTELDAMLNDQLDPLMEKFQSTNSVFYNAYQTARAIVDSAASHKAKTAAVTPIPVPLAKAA